MLPFPIQIQPGQPIYEQIVHAVKRALVTGHMKPGDRFPAVRTISAELQVNPNTVQKAATVLIHLGILEVRSGQGSFIAEPLLSGEKKSRLKLLEPYVENLLIEAARQGLDADELESLIRTQARKMKRP